VGLLSDVALLKSRRQNSIYLMKTPYVLCDVIHIHQSYLLRQSDSIMYAQLEQNRLRLSDLVLLQLS